MNALLNLVRRSLRLAGVDLVRYVGPAHPVAGLMSQLEGRSITCVFDVGANRGNFGSFLREAGYRGRIVSCEPQKEAFRVLGARAAKDGNWKALNCAVGEIEGVLTLNVAGNSESSSFLTMEQAHVNVAPQSRYVGQETSEVVTTENLVLSQTNTDDRVFIKIDTQGYEKHVIDGLHGLTSRIEGFQVELSLVPLYVGEWHVAEALERLKSLGYGVFAVQPGFFNPDTGEILQVDIICFRVQ